MNHNFITIMYLPVEQKCIISTVKPMVIMSLESTRFPVIVDPEKP